jgi:GAF domain-containing protein
MTGSKSVEDPSNLRPEIRAFLDALAELIANEIERTQTRREENEDVTIRRDLRKRNS